MEATANPSSAQGSTPRWMWIVGAAVALGATGLASALAWKESSRSDTAPPAMQTAAVNPGAGATPAAPQPAPARHEPPAPVAQRAEAAAPICNRCGVVESVQAVKVKGEASGVGAVAGGVLGGVVGNQFGKGNGRAAMTVLGAVGGGVAGNEVEKHVKAKTVYSVRVRMDDGSVRTVQQAQPPATGTRVEVDGSTLRAI